MESEAREDSEGVFGSDFVVGTVACVVVLPLSARLWLFTAAREGVSEAPAGGDACAGVCDCAAGGLVCACAPVCDCVCGFVEAILAQEKAGFCGEGETAVPDCVVLVVVEGAVVVAVCLPVAELAGSAGKPPSAPTEATERAAADRGDFGASRPSPTSLSLSRSLSLSLSLSLSSPSRLAVSRDADDRALDIE